MAYYVDQDGYVGKSENVVNGSVQIIEDDGYISEEFTAYDTLDEIRSFYYGELKFNRTFD